MIEAAMYVALGFCTAGLIALAILPAFYRRAARLTEEALRAVNPASYAEVRAAQDQERARFAVEMRRVETHLEAERAKALEHHVRASRLTAEIEALKKEKAAETGELMQKLAASDQDHQAVDLLTAEIADLKKKLGEAEKALAESWNAPEKQDTQAAQDVDIDQQSADWLPATDTMTLATITGLEAEVAMLKSKLSKYEPSVASELDAERKETARSRLADLEAQLVDTESKFIAAQAEVTRLSLQLDAIETKQPELQSDLQKQIEELSSRNATHQAQIKSKERSIKRLSGENDKLREDLASIPDLKSVREDFRQLVGKLAGLSGEPSSNAPKTPSADRVSGTKDISLKPKRRPRKAGSGSRPKAPSPAAPTSAEADPAKTVDIASAADALVSRIVASNRGRKKSEGTSEQNLKSEPANEDKVLKNPPKPKQAKQKSKDVA